MKANLNRISKIIILIFLLSINFHCKSQKYISKIEDNKSKLYSTLNHLLYRNTNHSFEYINIYIDAENTKGILFAIGTKNTVKLSDQINIKQYKYKEKKVIYFSNKNSSDEIKTLFDNYLEKDDFDISKIINQYYYEEPYIELWLIYKDGKFDIDRESFDEYYEYLE